MDGHARWGEPCTIKNVEERGNSEAYYYPGVLNFLKQEIAIFRYFCFLVFVG